MALTFLDKGLASISYSGTGTSKYRVEGSQGPLRFFYGTTVDLKTGRLLCLPDIFDVNDHFTEVFLKYANEQLSAEQGRPFSASANGVLVKEGLQSTSHYMCPSFYTDGADIVVLWSMWDNQNRPVAIPLSELAGDVRPEYRGILG